MSPKEVLALLESNGLSIDSLIVAWRPMFAGEERLLREFVELCAKPNEINHKAVLAAHVVMARATEHPYATVMENLYNKRAEKYGYQMN